MLHVPRPTFPRQLEGSLEGGEIVTSCLKLLFKNKSNELRFPYIFLKNLRFFNFIFYAYDLKIKWPKN